MSVREARHESGNLSLRVKSSATGWSIEWLGASEARDPSEFLEPLVDEWASRFAGVPGVIDLTKLEFMNSATVRPLLAMVRDFDAHEIPTRLLFTRHGWQRTFIRCLKTLTRSLSFVSVESETNP